MRSFARLRLLLAPLLTLLLFGCGEEKRFVGDCEADTDCPVGSYCKRDARDSTGLCACRSDEACSEGEFCNVEGICQKATGCRSNADCADASKFCDLVSGACVDRTGCGFDVHCPAGTVCDPGGQRCVNGCRDSGDCKLFEVCDRTGLPAGAELGTCLGGICEDDSYCPFGLNCVGRQCVPTTHPDFCAECGSVQGCSDPSSFCLINAAYDPQNPMGNSANFCGVECTDDPSICPSGYNCGSVVLLTQDQCNEDADCGGGGRRCRVDEGDRVGFCTCVEDADCQVSADICQQTCGGLGIRPCASDADCSFLACESACSASQRACTTDADCPGAPQCQFGICARTGRPCSTESDCNLACRNGGCYLGDACAPEQGLSCSDVRP